MVTVAKAESMWYESGALPVRFSICFSTSCPAGGLMHHGGMQRVELVLEEDLPVGVLDDTETVGHDLHLALGGAVAHVVEGDTRGAEELGERRAILGEAREHEAAVALDARCLLHAAIGIVRAEAGAGVARFHHRDLAQPAVVVEGPGVVRAAEELAGVAVPVAAHEIPPVRAAV